MIDTDTPLERFVSSHDPLISIVVTSYKKAAFIPECLNSIIAQSYRNFEILVVNDGSPDNTSEVVNNLIRQNPSIRMSLLEKENGGVSDARNYGIAHAQGRLLMVIDGDDKIFPNYLEKALEGFRQGQGDIFQPMQQNFGEATDQWHPEPYDPYFIRYSNCFPTPSIFDRKYFDLSGGYKRCLTYCEDWEFWVNCSRYNPRVIRADQALTCWRRTSDGLFAEGVAGKWEEAFTAISILNEDLYPVKAVLESIEFVKKMADSHIQKFEHFNTRLPNEWFPKLVLGIKADSIGNTEKALNHLLDAQKIVGNNNWIVFYLLGLYCGQQGNLESTRVFMHQVRTLRPDMELYVKQFIDQ